MNRKSILVAGMVLGSLFLLGVSPALQELLDRVAATEDQLAEVSPAVRGLMDRVAATEDQLAAIAAAPKAPRVFDADGTDLGRLLSGLSTDPEVYHDGVAAVFRVTTSGAVERRITVSFEEPGCEGRAFTSHNDGRDIGRLAVIGPEFGPNRFFVGTPEVAEKVTILSRFGGAVQDSCENIDRFDVRLFVAREVTAAELGFVYPVAMPRFFGPPSE